MKSRRVLTGVCLLITSLLLTASGSGGSGESGPATLTFQPPYDQPDTIADTRQIVDASNKATPDLQVKVVPAGWDGIYDKLTTVFTSGTAPDIFHAEAAGIGTFAANGYLADLSSYMSAQTRADISQGLLDSVTVN